MNPEIEELRKFTKAAVTKARLGKLRDALSNATALFLRLEPKPGDEDAAEDFDSTQSELESALDELESACDELDAAEDKDEREDAQDQISSALEDALTYFDEIMPVAVVGDPAKAKLVAECKAKLAELNALPKEQQMACLSTWLDTLENTEDGEKKRQCLQRLVQRRK